MKIKKRRIPLPKKFLKSNYHATLLLYLVSLHLLYYSCMLCNLATYIINKRFFKPLLASNVNIVPNYIGAF